MNSSAALYGCSGADRRAGTLGSERIVRGSDLKRRPSYAIIYIIGSKNYQSGRQFNIDSNNHHLPLPIAVGSVPRKTQIRTTYTQRTREAVPMIELLILVIIVLTVVTLSLALAISEIERRRSAKRLNDYYKSMSQFREMVPFEGIDQFINPKRGDE